MKDIRMRALRTRLGVNSSKQPRYARPYRAHGLFGASVGVPRKKTRRRRHVGNQAQHTFMERC